MSADPQTCHVCGAPRPLYKLGLRGYCGKHRPGMREEVAIIARIVRLPNAYDRTIILEPVVPAEGPRAEAAEDLPATPDSGSPRRAEVPGVQDDAREPGERDGTDRT